jgi:hypothetical protein
VAEGWSTTSATRASACCSGEEVHDALVAERRARSQSACDADPHWHRRGAVYDALVALAAREHGARLATRDARAPGTYDAVSVEVIIAP